MKGRIGLCVVVFACAPEPPARTPTGTSVVILTNACRLSKAASRETEATMGRLVDTCNIVVSRPLAFGVVLEPGGAISFATVADGGDEIPACVATQKLQHHAKLAAPCRLDVRFEPATIAVPP